jgi:hypothetical protein
MVTLRLKTERRKSRMVEFPEEVVAYAAHPRRFDILTEERGAEEDADAV